MSAAEGLRQPVDAIAAIDHHAHLLGGPDAGVELAAALCESTERDQIDQALEHPAYQRAVHELANETPNGFVSRAHALVGKAGLGAMLIDDGYRFPGALTLAAHADLVGCPVFRIVRIETEAEVAAEGWPPFTEVHDRFARSIAAAMANGAVALKTIAAYRCGLDLPAPDAGHARAAYDEWRRGGSHRLTDPALVSFFVTEAIEASPAGIPLQVHTGFGDTDAHLARADPALLQPGIHRGPLRGVPVVLLHTYPFVRNASYLAGVYANVYLDLSLAMTFVAHRGPALIAEALDLAPATKLLFGTDASRVPELFLLGTRWWRDALCRELGRLVDEEFVTETVALRWARSILADRARRLYRLPAAIG